jgi:hypothetical protein
VRRSFPDEVTCDRCSCFVSPHNAAHLVGPDVVRMGERREHDLCSQCWRDLVALIQKGTR